ncbi:hypothetical protein PsorP6_013089 [Peronosclerospora sorghi]|uniref:Uncharacterized protein n=1 Tax=Peronosclerospora sorghi TaxID=230839 RepID=A0ACC0WHN8_9STRA|nr:hypothetical protein PsorP6_013089 [Peronosclerospora sorghi]
MARLAEAIVPLASSLMAATVLKEKSSLEEPHREASCEADENDEKRNGPERDQTDDAETASMAVESVDVQETVHKHVRFNVADVVEFEPTMWTATVSSEGVPLGMSVDVRRRTKLLLDTYEIERVTQRVDRQDYMELGYLEPDERLDILEHAGHSISIISHIERDTLRINRERWESNEYDLMYQYGLGEVPLMEDNSLELMQQDDGDEIMHGDDSNDDYYFYAGSNKNLLADSEIRFTMEDIDAYDTIDARTYDSLSIDYTSDCILGDNEGSDENNELPYAIDSFESPPSCDLLEMGTSPSDVSSSPECMLASVTATRCAQKIGTTSTACSSTPSGNPLISASVVAA